MVLKIQKSKIRSGQNRSEVWSKNLTEILSATFTGQDAFSSEY